MKRTDIVYQGIKVSKRQIRAILEEHGYPKELFEGIPKTPHMTGIFLPVDTNLYKPEELGERVTLHAIAIGELWENGELTNIGLLIDDTEHLSQNEIAHITCYVGKNGKAVRTKDCKFSKKVNYLIPGRKSVFMGDGTYGYTIEY